MNLTEQQIAEMLTSEEGQAIISQQVQDLTNQTKQQYEAELAAKQLKLDNLKKETMSERERTEYEFKQREQQLQEHETRLKRAALEHYAHEQLAYYKLSKDALPFIMGGNEVEIIQKVGALRSFVNQQVREQQGQQPAASPAQAANDPYQMEKNPFSKEHWNLTNQGRMLRDFPEKARQMAAQHGHQL